MNLCRIKTKSLTILLGLVLAAGVLKQGEAAVGVNWGTISHHRLSPKTAVDLLKVNKISKVKLFDADPQVVNALRGCGIQVMVGIPNEMLSLLGSSPAAADLWVRQNLTTHLSAKPPADISHWSKQILQDLSSLWSHVMLMHMNLLSLPKEHFAQT